MSEQSLLYPIICYYFMAYPLFIYKKKPEVFDHFRLGREFITNYKLYCPVLPKPPSPRSVSSSSSTSSKIALGANDNLT